MKLGAFACPEAGDRQSLDDAFAGIRGFLDRKVKALLVVEDNDPERAQHRGRDRRRRRPDHRRRHRRRGAGGARRAGRSTAWCSTSACPTWAAWTCSS